MSGRHSRRTRMPLRPYRNLFSVILFVVGAAALAPLRAPAPAVAAGGHRPLPAAVREALGERLRPHDQPAEALEFYRLKRAPAGQSQVPVERYFQALQAMRFMPQHSIARGAVLTSRGGGGLEAIGEESNLGGWTALGPGNIGGRTRALVVDPRQPSALYAAGVAGGVWKSTDTGVSWRPLADLLANIAINSLAMDPANSSVLYAGTGEGYFNIDAVRGAGIFKTTDGGATWTRLAATTGFGYVNDIVISSRDGRRVYAATDTGVWRSLDGGATWSQVLATTVFGGCLDLAIRTDQRTDWVFAACGTFEQATVYRSTAAESAGPWLRVLTERAMGRTTLAIAPSNQDVIYAVAAVNANDDSDQGLLAIFRSTTGGGPKSWTAQVRNTDPRPLNTLLLSNPVIATLKECGFGDTDFLFNQGWYDETLAVDPRDPNRVWLGGIDLFRSDDGGRTWGLASYWWGQDPSGDAPSYAHADQHVLVFDPRYDGAANRTLYVGNDGGVFRTL